MKILKYALSVLRGYRFIMPMQALTLAVISLAFPANLQLGSNLVISSLSTALFLAFALMISAAITLRLFDFTRVGEYILSFATVSFKERLAIYTGTMALSALALQLFALVFPSVFTVSDFLAAFLAVNACQLVSHGVDRTKELFTEKDIEEGPTRQGRRPKK